MKGFIFEELNGGEACRTYLVACPRTREALLVDPVLEHVPYYLVRLERDGLRLSLVVDTHTHVDHVSGGPELARATGCVHAGKPEGAVHRVLSEGDVLSVGEVHLLVWETPGHTADSLALVMEDRVLSGDTLLSGAPGRRELPTAEAGLQGLRRLLSLPGELLVFPSHDAAGRTFTTIERERLNHPHLRLEQEHTGWATIPHHAV
jgi:glyoxylase-like metal-dependent hydrolase (beta-lactamase superfamily II)